MVIITTTVVVSHEEVGVVNAGIVTQLLVKVSVEVALTLSVDIGV